MAYIRIHEILENLASSGIEVFGVNDLTKLTGKSRQYISRRLSVNKNVIRIERNKYFIRGTDSLKIASNIIYPSYISTFSAFRYYDIVTQLPSKINIVSVRKHKKIILNNDTVEFKTLDKRRFFGYAKKNGAFIADVEKSIIDALYIGEPPYGYVNDAFARALSKNIIDIKKLVYYTYRMNSNALASKVGYMMESNGFDAPELYKNRSKRYIKLVGMRVHNNKWMIQ